MLSSGWHAWAERRITLLTRVPSPGRVKTRLAATIGDAAAADAARAFLEDALGMAAEAAARVGGRLVVHTDPDDPGPTLARLIERRGAAHAPQGTGGLGARLRRALEAAPGAARVVLGSDAPDLPADHLVEALRRVEEVPVVLGPTTARDGGFHLLALAGGAPSAWLEGAIRWSTPHALDDTVAAARAAGLEVGRGPAWPDVDDQADLAALAARLAATPGGAPRTRAWLRDRRRDRGSARAHDREAHTGGAPGHDGDGELRIDRHAPKSW
ncbi:MAG: DUF2064 domain-containing protein [Planctomycetes bacterium]|nr:DUF2064 domain-containing protein [Planctomycetota bacterium]